jgi:hypothetical protein
VWLAACRTALALRLSPAAAATPVGATVAG